MQTQNMPRAVCKAFVHVRKFFPSVTQVFYGVDGRWLFCEEAFESPTFGDEIDVGILEDAADAVDGLPAAFAWGDNMIAWHVHSDAGWRHDSNGKIVWKHNDTVFYEDDCGPDYVRRSLINHDGYPDDIVVTKEKSRGRTTKQA